MTTDSKNSKDEAEFHLALDDESRKLAFERAMRYLTDQGIDLEELRTNAEQALQPWDGSMIPFDQLELDEQLEQEIRQDLGMTKAQMDKALVDALELIRQEGRDPEEVMKCAIETVEYWRGRELPLGLPDDLTDLEDEI